MSPRPPYFVQWCLVLYNGSVVRIVLTPLDIAACYADYHVYNAVNTKLQSLPPDKGDKQKKPAGKKTIVKPRPGADIYQRKMSLALGQTPKVCTDAIVRRGITIQVFSIMTGGLGSRRCSYPYSVVRQIGL